MLIVWLAHATGSTGFDLRCFTADSLVTLLMLALPWGLMLFLRYLPANWYFRSAAACGWGSLWVWTCPLLLDTILSAFYGWQDGLNTYTLTTPFTAFRPDFACPWFWDALLILSLAVAALVLACLGLRQQAQNK